jgi:hypothetical protein
MDGELASSCMDLLGVDELAGQVIFQGLCVVIRGAIRIVFNSEEGLCEWKFRVRLPTGDCRSLCST